jgi:hypothetical protein
VVNFTLYSAQRTAIKNNSTNDITVTGLILTKNLSLSGRVDQVFPDNQLFILYMSKLNSNDNFYWQLNFSPNSRLTPGTYYLNVMPS